jgi:hypothetical protein
MQFPNVDVSKRFNFYVYWRNRNLNFKKFQSSAQKYTQFTGNKQPCTTKECILIYDTKTNEFTLERLQSNIILKRSR